MKHERDIYQEVTDRIIASLEAGTAPWTQPWEGGGFQMPRNGVSGRNYSGINVFLLWIASQRKGYASPEWFTFNGAKSKGASVRKGEKGTEIVFFKPIEVKKRNDKGEEEKKKILLLRSWHVFNRAQIDGLPAEKGETRPEAVRFAAADAVIEGTGAVILPGSKAFYMPATDTVTLPARESFKSNGGYYSTAFHELGHWTGAKVRLNRHEENSRFGSESYAREELVAELTSAFLCAEVGVEKQFPEEKGALQHDAYVKSWLDVLRADKKAIFTAASAARKAAAFILKREDAAVASPDETTTADAA